MDNGRHKGTLLDTAVHGWTWLGNGGSWLTLVDTALVNADLHFWILVGTGGH